jgi:uncharacterized protein YjiS (DUF1127 family)
LQCSIDGAAVPARRLNSRTRSVFVSLILSRWRDWLRYRETLRELSRLTDRELDDVGVSRSDIPHVARLHTGL